MVISRITMVHDLATQERMAPLSQMAYWDAHARYLHASALFPATYGDEDEGLPLLTMDGNDAEEVLDQEGLAVVPTLAAVAEDLWHSTDCNTLEVTTDAARWTCVWGDNVRLTTWDVPVRLFETLADMKETANVSQ